MTSLSAPALRVTVFVGEDDRHHHRPLCTEIVHRAFLPELEELVHEGLIIVDEVEVVRYVGRRGDRAADDR